MGGTIHGALLLFTDIHLFRLERGFLVLGDRGRKNPTIMKYQACLCNVCVTPSARPEELVWKYMQFYHIHIYAYTTISRKVRTQRSEDAGGTTICQVGVKVCGTQKKQISGRPSIRFSEQNALDYITTENVPPGDLWRERRGETKRNN